MSGEGEESGGYEGAGKEEKGILRRERKKEIKIRTERDVERREREGNDGGKIGHIRRSNIPKDYEEERV